MYSQDFSEHSIPPRAILVHDPTAYNAFSEFATYEDGEELLATGLFRKHPNVEEFHRQHVDFVRVLKKEVHVMYLSEILGDTRVPAYESYLKKNPNHVYTHDAMMTIPWIPDGYILGNMKKAIRRDEPVVLAKVAEILGYKEIVKIPSHLYLEGGDVMPFCYDGRKTLLIGFGPRTAEDTLFYLQETLVQDGLVDEIIGFKLADWRLNIDGCFFPVSEDTIVSHTGSILGGRHLGRDWSRDIDPVSFFRDLGFDIVEATPEESFFLQACNFVCLGAGKLVAYDMTDRINNILRQKGLEVIGFGGDQLVKGNGGPHCMTRPLYSTE